MIARAHEKYIRISPKKLRIVAELVRYKPVSEALYILMLTNKRGARVLEKVIQSALGNVKSIPEKEYKEKVEELYISRLIVNSGPMLKRYRAMSLGRAGMIRRRTSHILVELDIVRDKKENWLKTEEKESKKTVEPRVADKKKKRFFSRAGV